ncbi:MAG: hypothetical protein DSZ03_04395 [Sulfurimonas sp.]|nr:MAG: hypothetical protein DSZ03_04395 [Sulfurimonas sp.]
MSEGRTILIVEDIEVSITGAIIDTSYSNDMDHIINKLIEIRNAKACSSRSDFQEIQTDPDLLEKRVIDALRHQRYSILFQKIECNSRSLVCDSSIKLLDDLGKIIHYKNYMSVISRLRLTREFDLLQFEAIYQYLQQYDSGIFAVSISASSLRQQLFFQKVQTLLSHNDFGKRLIFITAEKEYFGNIKRFNEILQSYRRMGIAIAIDNLGGNQTSLLYMKDLHIDMVLFDTNFSKRICKRGYKEIIEGFVVAARELKLKSWVRMIEDETMYAEAKQMKIDCIQGHYIGKFENLETILKTEH